MDTHKKVEKWGAPNLCPGCQKPVYPNDKVFGADRQPFHRGCITCGTRGCGNSLTSRGIFRHGNINVCTMCNEDMYGPAKEYGPAPGMESLAERKAREAKTKEEYERKLREIEEKRNAGPDDFNKVCQVSCMKVASLVAF
eukprot:TRINITY_DN3578_c0_g1_i3.p1 TRINITY_DN3578_c0_g1~~TRINITY_DN3578_c0_g1_i3.p1  ORF type:complete len:140 (-),score=30.25 TRINITY_DN3578_c0_g1_i3:82-501(-)